jgi:hypothetical protein
MTTNNNLRPGMLIEYKGAHQTDTAWVLEAPVPARTDGLVKIRVKGESGINIDSEFDIFVKATGRAKIREGAELAEQPAKKARAKKADGPFSGAAILNAAKAATDAPVIKTARATGSHAECSHESSKPARAACRKARAATAND